MNPEVADETVLDEELAGFNDDSVDAENKEQAPAPEAVEVAPEAPVVKEAPPVQTADQVALNTAIAELERYRVRADKLDGNYGEIVRRLEEMKAAAATPAAAAKYELAEDSFSALDELGLPDLKAAIATSTHAEIQRALQSVPGSTSSEELRRIATEVAIEAQTNALQKQKEEQISELAKAYPDYREMQTTPEWQQWWGTLSPSKQERLKKSNNADYVIDNLDTFVAWRDTVNKKKQVNVKRVNDSVTPTGRTANQPAISLSAHEEELAGFNSND